MSNSDIRSIIEAGRARLGVEFGSTRIKAVLTDPAGDPIAQGAHDWENQLVNNIWTYDMKDVWAGIQDCYAKMAADVKERYGVTLTKLEAIGISAMMHGYIPFDGDGNQLVPFRTWRNTITGPASEALTKLFNFNIPQRWSIAHLYQAILNGEPHVPQIRFLTTLEGYVHWMLTGEKVLGIGEGAGMFPIDSTTNNYDAKMVADFDALIADKGFPWKLEEILPKVLMAGDRAGELTEAGAKLLDVSGNLKPGVPLCPPEGDAGTGMVATNSVAARTGNVSAGTSVFAMIVLEKPLRQLHTEIDMVTTPTGKPVAMVHCNTCTSDLNAWVKLLGEAAALFGTAPDTNTLYTRLFEIALQGRKDCGSVTAFNYFSGEPITGTSDGVPLLTRRPDQPMTLADFMRAQIYASLATLGIGMKILTGEEQVGIDRVLGHGGLFKTPVVGQSILAAAINSPVTVMATAGEGGAWGIALLADYCARRRPGQTLEDWLDREVFADMASETLAPDPADVAGFEAYIRRFEAAVPAEKAACAALKGE